MLFKVVHVIQIDEVKGIWAKISYTDFETVFPQFKMKFIWL